MDIGLLYVCALSNYVFKKKITNILRQGIIIIEREKTLIIIAVLQAYHMPGWPQHGVDKHTVSFILAITTC